MGSVTDIAQALLDVLATLADVDYTSINDFIPAVQSQKVAALIVPFGQTTVFEPDSLDEAVTVAIHRLRVEFWIKHTQGKPEVTAQRARDIATQALTALMANDGTDYELAMTPTDEAVDPALVSHNNISWLVSTLTVPVRNVIAVGD